MIEVIAAHRDGGADAIQYFASKNLGWLHPYVHPGWDFDEIKWRLTPSPHKPREFWISLDENGAAVAGMAYIPGHGINAIRVREVLPSTGEEGIPGWGKTVILPLKEDL